MPRGSERSTVALHYRRPWTDERCAVSLSVDRQTMDCGRGGGGHWAVRGSPAAGHVLLSHYGISSSHLVYMQFFFSTLWQLASNLIRAQAVCMSVSG